MFGLNGQYLPSFSAFLSNLVQKQFDIVPVAPVCHCESEAL